MTTTRPNEPLEHLFDTLEPRMMFNVAVLYPSADAEVSKASPDDNSGDKATLVVQDGNDLNPQILNWALLRFDTAPKIPWGSTINSAVLHLYTLQVTNPDEQPWVELRAIQGPWTELGVTWNNKPSTGGTVNDEAHIDETGWKDSYWDSPGLRSLVEQWAAAPDNNFGVALRPMDETSSMIFASREEQEPGDLRPYLQVDFTPPPDPFVIVTPDPVNINGFIDIEVRNVPGNIDAISLFVDWNNNGKTQFDKDRDVGLGINNRPVDMGDGVWRLDDYYVGTFWGTGPTRFVAQLLDGGVLNGRYDDVIQIKSGGPRVMDVVGDPDPAYWNQPLELTATAQDDGSVSKVTFWYDKSGNGLWNNGDVPLGEAEYTDGKWRAVRKVQQSWGQGPDKRFYAKAWDNTGRLNVRPVSAKVDIGPGGRPDGDDPSLDLGVPGDKEFAIFRGEDLGQGPRVPEFKSIFSDDTTDLDAGGRWVVTLDFLRQSLGLVAAPRSIV